jgi:hypothetical protein
MDVQYTYLDGLRLPVLFFPSTDLTGEPVMADTGTEAAEGAAD